MPLQLMLLCRSSILHIEQFNIVPGLLLLRFPIANLQHISYRALEHNSALPILLPVVSQLGLMQPDLRIGMRCAIRPLVGDLLAHLFQQCRGPLAEPLRLLLYDRRKIGKKQGFRSGLEFRIGKLRKSSAICGRIRRSCRRPNRAFPCASPWAASPIFSACNTALVWRVHFRNTLISIISNATIKATANIFT